jgi:hypothetical protein
MRIYYHLALFAGLLFIVSCSSSKKLQSTKSSGISGIKFISEYIIPNGTQFNGTTVGGLSGIDYDAKQDLYYMICDDPSATNPARFYTAKIIISQKGIDSVQFTRVDTLLNSEGKPYPDIRKDRIHSADLEAMRYDGSRDEFIWSSEGQRVTRDSIRDLQNPAIVITDRNGRYKDSFALPLNMQIRLEEKGPRHNSVFEGLSFDEDHSHVYVNVEEPIYEDGPKAGTGDSTAMIRILKFNRKLKECVAQYAYEIDPIPYPANPPGAFKINGVPDILYLSNDKFIVIERAFSTGRIPTDVKIFLADAAHAEDVSPLPSVKALPANKYITKRLLLDVNKSLSFDIFNIEGVTFGPMLANGHRSLLLVTDNNFNVKEKTQFFLFEVLP